MASAAATSDSGKIVTKILDALRAGDFGALRDECLLYMFDEADAEIIIKAYKLAVSSISRDERQTMKDAILSGNVDLVRSLLPRFSMHAKDPDDESVYSSSGAICTELEPGHWIDVDPDLRLDEFSTHDEIGRLWPWIRFALQSRSNEMLDFVVETTDGENVHGWMMIESTRFASFLFAYTVDKNFYGVVETMIHISKYYHFNTRRYTGIYDGVKQWFRDLDKFVHHKWVDCGWSRLNEFLLPMSNDNKKEMVDVLYPRAVSTDSRSNQTMAMGVLGTYGHEKAHELYRWAQFERGY